LPFIKRTQLMATMDSKITNRQLNNLHGREASLQPDDDQPIDVPQPHRDVGLVA
jgi:hypothetical protein